MSADHQDSIKKKNEFGSNKSLSSKFNDILHSGNLARWRVYVDSMH